MINNLLNNAKRSVNNVAGTPNEGRESFPKTLKTDSFMDGDVAVTAGEYTKLGQFRVPAQEQYRFGKGAAEYEANQGYIYILIQNGTPEEITGSVRLQQRDAQERNILTVFEEEAEVLHESKSNREQQVPLPLQDNYPKVGRDSKLVVAFNADTTDTVSAANTEMLIPVTVYPV